MKLQSKINLFSTAMFIVLLLLINSAIYFSFSRMLYDSALERVTGEAKQTVKGINRVKGSIPADDLLRAYVPANGMLQVVTADGSRIASVTTAEQSELRKKIGKVTKDEQKKIMTFNGTPYAVVSIPMIWRDGEVVKLQLAESMGAVERNLNTLRAVLIAAMLLASIPVFLSSRLLSNFITSPIASLTRTMKEIQESGRYKKIELPKQSKDELYQMGETFNNMIAQLEANYQKQEQFVENASHELKTPLTVIEAYADLLLRRGKNTPELFEESVEAIHSEAHRMRNLIEQLLLLAKHDEQWNVEMENVALKGFVEESIKSFREGFKREIELFIEADATVVTDPQKLKQLLYIFLDNAQKYSDKKIKVNVKIRHHQALIEVIDFGMGIPKEELSKVFDRFYRVEQSRARKTGGFGLGLPLAKELAAAIHADVKLESEPGKGTTAQVWLDMPASH
ncbi:ATP-binding protein [Siminovitchia sp. FSL H7-0308]|uniref:histidine kinase n=1 Tax=Siminovitchia thermophila TaxID=1245522 RepID=A0ABS2RDU8_9BACI|nr:ATP-binding protein [Siminovitchia thermophila]MBM7717369.1 signal transduction histidine kinase [Siminovitchia thermophila]ONK22920.1 two-component sensor histidine kinase [Bacillus sp. VT-16-64]